MLKADISHKILVAVVFRDHSGYKASNLQRKTYQAYAAPEGKKCVSCDICEAVSSRMVFLGEYTWHCQRLHKVIRPIEILPNKLVHTL